MQMQVPPDLRYTKTHEWAKRDTTDVLVGITSHAQEELRDVVFVELPKVGRAVKQGEAVAVIESVKAAFDIYAPISGTISRINETVGKNPQLVNQDCYGAGWLYAIAPGSPADLESLLPADAYAKQIQTSAH